MGADEAYSRSPAPAAETTPRKLARFGACDHKYYTCEEVGCSGPEYEDEATASATLDEGDGEGARTVKLPGPPPCDACKGTGFYWRATRGGGHPNACPRGCPPAYVMNAAPVPPPTGEAPPATLAERLAAATAEKERAIHAQDWDAAVLARYTERDLQREMAAAPPAPDRLRDDTALLDALEARGVVSIYFADGSQCNPGSQSLRAALTEERGA